MLKPDSKGIRLHIFGGCGGILFYYPSIERRAFHIGKNMFEDHKSLEGDRVSNLHFNNFVRKIQRELQAATQIINYRNKDDF